MRLLTVLPGPDAEEISCSLEVASLRAGLHYEALSHTWGPSIDSHEISINGLSQRFPVRANLYQAFLQLRR